jgi:hypothetical protein
MIIKFRKHKIEISYPKKDLHMPVSLATTILYNGIKLALRSEMLPKF